MGDGVFFPSAPRSCLFICLEYEYIYSIYPALDTHETLTEVQTGVRRPCKTRHSFAFKTDGCLLLNESSADSRSFLRYFHSAMGNHLSIAISMSPEWVVAYNRFNFIYVMGGIFGITVSIEPYGIVSSGQNILNTDVNMIQVQYTPVPSFLIGKSRGRRLFNRKMEI